jgi:hypothetical protein
MTVYPELKLKEYAELDCTTPAALLNHTPPEYVIELTVSPKLSI